MAEKLKNGERHGHGQVKKVIETLKKIESKNLFLELLAASREKRPVDSRWAPNLWRGGWVEIDGTLKRIVHDVIESAYPGTGLEYKYEDPFGKKRKVTVETELTATTELTPVSTAETAAPASTSTPEPASAPQSQTQEA